MRKVHHAAERVPNSVAFPSPAKTDLTPQVPAGLTTPAWIHHRTALLVGQSTGGILCELDRLPQVRYVRHGRIGRELPLLGQGFPAAA